MILEGWSHSWKENSMERISCDSQLSSCCCVPLVKCCRCSPEQSCSREGSSSGLLLCCSDSVCSGEILGEDASLQIFQMYYLKKTLISLSGFTFCEYLGEKKLNFFPLYETFVLLEMAIIVFKMSLQMFQNCITLCKTFYKSFSVIGLFLFPA